MSTGPWHGPHTVDPSLSRAHQELGTDISFIFFLTVFIMNYLGHTGQFQELHIETGLSFFFF
jgi:hypothetical protein